MAVQPVGPVGSGQGAPPERIRQGAEFAATFQQVLGQAPLRLSAHAAERLQQSGVQLGPEAMASVNAAVAAAAAKGGKNALVVMGSPALALVVSVSNRTVVTAIDGARMGQGVFTGIDSAVIAQGPVPLGEAQGR